MRNFWRTHIWPENERRLHWLVVFDDEPRVHDCYLRHEPLLRQFPKLLDVVPLKWLHMTIQSLCPTTAVTSDEVQELVAAVRGALRDIDPPRVQLGPARLDGAGVTWAVYPETALAAIQARVREESLKVLGTHRVAPQRGPWWPHVTLGYGAADEPADELAATLARAGLPRVDVTIDDVVLVDQEQDLAKRQYRWRVITSVRIGRPTTDGEASAG